MSVEHEFEQHVMTGTCRNCGQNARVHDEEICNEYSGGAKKDMINHPPHYRSHPSGIECIQVTEHMNFNLGNAVKYIWRAGEKGKIVEDLEKAIWYLRREVERISK